MDASSDTMNKNGIDRYIFSLLVMVVSVRRFEIGSSVKECCRILESLGVARAMTRQCKYYRLCLYRGIVNIRVD